MIPLPLLPNPWLILGILIALLGAAGAGYTEGLSRGKDSQLLVDQTAISKVTSQIETMKQDADHQLIAKQTELTATLVARDQLKTQLSQEHQTNVQNTNKLRDAYAAYSLRFAGQAEPAGPGDSNTNTVSTEGGTASDPRPAVFELSTETAGALRSIVFDCDSLRDDYTLLFTWAHSPKRQ